MAAIIQIVRKSNGFEFGNLDCEKNSIFLLIYNGKRNTRIVKYT